MLSPSRTTPSFSPTRPANRLTWVDDAEYFPSTVEVDFDFCEGPDPDMREDGDGWLWWGQCGDVPKQDFYAWLDQYGVGMVLAERWQSSALFYRALVPPTDDQLLDLRMRFF